MFKNNPEEYIYPSGNKHHQGAESTMIVEDIHYNITEEKYDSDIFTVKSKMDFDRAYEPRNI
ncbi:MAG: hypothetical protein IKA45_06390 [Bacteroidales bacterium]|nr:hypothetical protein [Bacteroidales bacterium]